MAEAIEKSAETKGSQEALKVLTVTQQDADTRILSLVINQLKNSEYSDLTVLVGPEEKEFKLHRIFVCQRSAFFKTAFQETWKEGATGIVKLPEIEPSTFELVVQWIYTGSFELVLDGNINSVEPIVKILKAADYLGVRGLEEELAKQIFHLYRQDSDPANSDRQWLGSSFTHNLCSMWSFKKLEPIVESLGIEIQASLLWREGQLINRKVDFSKDYLRCYSEAHERLVKGACSTCRERLFKCNNGKREAFKKRR